MRFTWLCFVFIITCGAAYAAPHFPELTGRVVDGAHILSPDAVQSLDNMLADYERGTTHQVVIVTVPSLEGYAIEDYGYQLGRTWKIGQQGKNNGVLLIVAPQEHKVRIEVGYGLEPVLTDAATSVIVQQIILPQFRSGNFQGGILEGTQAILDVLGGKGVPANLHVNAGEHDMGFAGILIMLLFWFIIFKLAVRHPLLAAMLMSSNMRFGGSSGGGFDAGGFSGGGGSFGGGGSSGSW